MVVYTGHSCEQVFPYMAITHQSLQQSTPSFDPPVMIPNLKVIFLFLWLLQCGGGNVDVRQEPPIQVALLKEGITIPCKVIFPYMPKYTKFSICYYWINSLDQKTSIHSISENVVIPPGAENTTATLSYSYTVAPLENTSSTGTYYCKVKWNDIQKMGKGVFVLVRDTGYINTSYGWKILVTLTVLLAVLCPRRSQPNILRQKVETQLPSASPLPPPVYDSLDVQQVDVYSSLENNTNSPPHGKSLPGKETDEGSDLVLSVCLDSVGSRFAIHSEISLRLYKEKRSSSENTREEKNHGLQDLFSRRRGVFLSFIASPN
ncbi:hypothetical protein IHE44_0012198 [Lamprotornis superbus]|uniref:Ig-like domain-containing protein n=1 Tax=Lamprotornis superbus TaxID=245042 RepID=A0A835NRH7_9PASS|nr:hypothetical protein IHE44_0012198 [Lamprotornis superbus]